MRGLFLSVMILVITVLMHRLKMSLPQRLLVQLLPAELIEVTFRRSPLISINQFVRLVMCQWCVHVRILVLTVPGVQLQIVVVQAVRIRRHVVLNDVVVTHQIVSVRVEIVVLLVMRWPLQFRVVRAMHRLIVLIVCKLRVVVPGRTRVLMHIVMRAEELLLTVAQGLQMVHFVPFLLTMVRVPRIEVVIAGLVLIRSAEEVRVALCLLC